jgi:cysteine desulfurase family protein (TIGR01976 family)
MTTLTLAVSRAMARYLSAGDEVLVTALDHDANVSAWLALKERGVNVRVVNVNVGNCTLDMEDFEKKLTTKTRLVAVGLAANSVGTINDLGKITQLARGVRALVFVDAVHYVPHDIVDVRALDCDFLICSAYKFFGPHVGVLYGKKDRLQEIRPYRLQASSATVPEAWETGTQNHEGLAGLSACIDYLAGIGRRSSPSEKNRRGALRAAFQCISEHERTLSERLVVGLRDLLGIRTYGLWDPSELSRRTPTFAFRCKDREPRELARKLGEKGIFVGDGNFYAIHLARKLSIDNCGGLVRVGLVHYNTIDEVDRFLREVSRLA